MVSNNRLQAQSLDPFNDWPIKVVIIKCCWQCHLMLPVATTRSRAHAHIAKLQSNSTLVTQPSPPDEECLDLSSKSTRSSHCGCSPQKWQVWQTDKAARAAKASAGFGSLPGIQPVTPRAYLTIQAVGMGMFKSMPVQALLAMKWAQWAD